MMKCSICPDSQDMPTTLILLAYLAGIALAVGVIVTLTMILAMFIRCCS
jgi:hypothetical protein